MTSAPPRMAARARAVTAALVAYLFALVLWMGGLVTLGAIVAPTVFRNVPMPASADAMTLVFRRFDAVAISCAVVCLVMEAVLAVRGGKALRVDLVRAAAAVVATGCAIAVGAWLSPGIHALHRAGAIRAVGPEGAELDRLHHLAENTSKIELTFLALVLVLLVLRARRSSS